MIEFLSNLLGLITSLLLAGLLGIAVLAALGILSLIMRRLARGARKLVDMTGLLHLHEKTVFQHSPSVKSRLAASNRRQQTFTVTPGRKPVAVLRFDGDVYATARRQFANLVDEVIVNKDRVNGAIVVVSSPGGGVAEYGQLYAEMERIRKAAIPLTVCVDTYAASGGYLMSLPANKIVAAPFAMVGSIGVVSELINAHQFLKNLGFEPLTLTAGRFKRTITPTGEITEEGKKHYQEQLETIHRLFIDAVTKYRPVDPAVVCTGDHWTAQESMRLKLGLVDELGTSQEHLFQVNQEQDLVFFSEATNPWEKGILRLMAKFSDHVLDRIESRFFRPLP